MTDLGDRLDALSREATASVTLLSPEQALRARSRRRRVGVTFALAVVTAAGAKTATLVVSNSGLNRVVTQPLSQGTLPSGAPSTFLVVHTIAEVTRPGPGPGQLYLVRYPSYELQVRSSINGSVQKTVLRSLAQISAFREPDGTILAIVDYLCRSDVELIDPQTGTTTPLRTLGGFVDDAALSPDASRLAYYTYPASSSRSSCTPSVQPAQPFLLPPPQSSPANFGPSVLTVTDLNTGASVKTVTTGEGQLSWNPQGTELAVNQVLGSQSPIAVVSAAHPDLAPITRIPAPAGCQYFSPAWTTSGLIVVEGCGSQPLLSPSRLVELKVQGGVTATWNLPTCIDGIQAITDAGHTHALIQADIGYGNGPPCGIPNPGNNYTQLMIVQSNTLQIVDRLTDPDGSSTIQIASW